MAETWANSAKSGRLAHWMYGRDLHAPQSPNRFRGCDLKANPGQSLNITIEMHDGALGAKSFFTMADHTRLHFSLLGSEIKVYYEGIELDVHILVDGKHDKSCLPDNPEISKF